MVVVHNDATYDAKPPGMVFERLRDTAVLDELGRGFGPQAGESLNLVFGESSDQAAQGHCLT